MATSARCGAMAATRAQGPGPDLQTNAVQTLCRCSGEEEKYDKIQGESEVRTCLPHLEARLRLREGALPRHRQEPSSAVRQLRPHQPLPAPQTTTPALRLQARNTASANHHRNHAVSHTISCLRRVSLTVFAGDVESLQAGEFGGVAGLGRRADGGHRGVQELGGE